MFFLRAAGLVRGMGTIGLLATNSLSQGDSATVGMRRILSNGQMAYRAQSSYAWPGLAGVTVAIVWMFLGDWAGTTELDGEAVSGLTSFFENL